MQNNMTADLNAKMLIEDRLQLCGLRCQCQFFQGCLSINRLIYVHVRFSDSYHDIFHSR